MRENQGSITVGEASYEAMWAKTIAETPRGRPAGPGWKSVADLAALMNCQQDAAARFAYRMVSLKKWESVKGTSPAGKMANYYRPILKKK
jgi:hypothetical protein